MINLRQGTMAGELLQTAVDVTIQKDWQFAHILEILRATAGKGRTNCVIIIGHNFAKFNGIDVYKYESMLEALGFSVNKDNFESGRIDQFGADMTLCCCDKEDSGDYKNFYVLSISWKAYRS